MWFVNVTAFVCESFETPLTQTNRQMCFFRQEIICSQSDVYFLFSQSQERTPLFGSAANISRLIHFG